MDGKVNVVISKVHWVVDYESEVRILKFKMADLDSSAVIDLKTFMRGFLGLMLMTILESDFRN